jgi:sugar fermentation stimulation protein A
MKYNKVVKGEFLSRPNRFIAKVKIKDEIHTVHVKNTGRCKELLVPNCTVYLAEADNPNRKTKYDLISVEKQRNNGSTLLINMDSQIVNSAAEEWLKKGELFGIGATIRREVTFGKSRFDFYIEKGNRKIFLEVKGVTLENNGVASFPDAPTERGIKHIKELITCCNNGFESYILFVIQMKGVREFTPNDVTHKAFGDALREAKKSGVNIIAMDCIVTPDSIQIDKNIKITL